MSWGQILQEDRDTWTNNSSPNKMEMLPFYCSHTYSQVLLTAEYSHIFLQLQQVSCFWEEWKTIITTAVKLHKYFLIYLYRQLSKKPCFIAVIFFLNAELLNEHNPMNPMQTVLYFLVPCSGQLWSYIHSPETIFWKFSQTYFSFHLFFPCYKYLCSGSNPPGIFL